MDTETGRIEGYRVRQEEGEAGHANREDGSAPLYAIEGNDNRWVTAHDGVMSLVLDRTTDHAWRLPAHLMLVAASQDALLIRDTRVSGPDILADNELREIDRFGHLGSPVFFSPPGDRLLFGAGGTVEVMALEGMTRELLFTSRPHEKWGAPLSVDFSPVRAGQEILVTVAYDVSDADGPVQRFNEWYRFDWDGRELSRVASPVGPTGVPLSWVHHSPDGRHLVWQERGLAIGFYEASEAWPSVVVADAATGQPILRVRSASLQSGGVAEWLATGDGVLLRTVPRRYGQGRTMLLRLRPDPRIDRLPALAGAIPNWPFLPGTLASPTGGDRFFVETYTNWETYTKAHDFREEIVGLYDAHHDRWHTAVLLSGSRYGDYDYLRPSWPSWGTSESELRLTFAGGKATGGGLYLFSEPKIELPPFSEEFAFRVARTGSCLHLRDIPDSGGAVLDCLPDGTRVVLSQSEEWAALDWSNRPSVDWWRGNRDCCDFGVFVRTEDGLEGWVAHDYLEHD